MLFNHAHVYVLFVFFKVFLLYIYIILVQGFKYTVAVMQTPEALERVGYEFAWDLFNEHVFFFEVRFAPQLHAGPSMDIATGRRADYDDGAHD